MKNIIVILIACLLLFTACVQRNETPNTQISPDTSPTSEPMAKVSDFFPFSGNIYNKYMGTGNEYASYETYVDYVKGNIMQVREINPGTVMTFVYQIDGDVLKKVFLKEETYYRYNFTSSSNENEIIIKSPIKEGTSWTLGNGLTRSITAVDTKIETPSGKYTALEVTTDSPQSTIKRYYARNIGLVKTEFTSKETSSTVTSELEKTELNTPLKQKIILYFPDFPKERIAYTDTYIELYSNEDIITKIQEELKKVPVNSELTKVLSTGTIINGSSIDEEKGTVTIDFSPQLITEMNAGSSLEGMLLQCITNTFGDYYQKDKVIITIDGKLYESGHMMLEPGQYFTVDKSNTVKYSG
jgi:hypothetical protein